MDGGVKTKVPSPHSAHSVDEPAPVFNPTPIPTVRRHYRAFDSPSHPFCSQWITPARDATQASFGLPMRCFELAKDVGCAELLLGRTLFDRIDSSVASQELRR